MLLMRAYDVTLVLTLKHRLPQKMVPLCFNSTLAILEHFMLSQLIKLSTVEMHMQSAS